MAGLSTNMATSTVSGSIAALVLKYLETKYQISVDEETAAAIVTVTIAAAHAAQAVAVYAISFLPKSPSGAPTP